jgi:hypothetical protein
MVISYFLFFRKKQPKSLTKSSYSTVPNTNLDTENLEGAQNIPPNKTGYFEQIPFQTLEPRTTVLGQGEPVPGGRVGVNEVPNGDQGTMERPGEMPSGRLHYPSND